MLTDARQVQLTQGQVAIVDAADYERVMQRRWRAQLTDGRWYASSAGGVLLHRFVFGAEPGQRIGFVNGDSLDCRRENLGLRTYRKAPQKAALDRDTLPPADPRPDPRTSRSSAGSRSGGGGALGLIGVAKVHNGTYQARIRHDCRNRYLGVFATARDAALAYNVAYRLLCGLDCRWSAEDPPNEIEAAVPVSELQEWLAQYAAAAKRKTGRPPRREAAS